MRIIRQFCHAWRMKVKHQIQRYKIYLNEKGEKRKIYHTRVGDELIIRITDENGNVLDSLIFSENDWQMLNRHIKIEDKISSVPEDGSLPIGVRNIARA